MSDHSRCKCGLDHHAQVADLGRQKAALEARVRHLQQFASTEGEHAAWHFLLTERIDSLKARAEKAETDVKGLLLSNDSLVDALEKAEARVKDLGPDHLSIILKRAAGRESGGGVASPQTRASKDAVGSSAAKSAARKHECDPDGACYENGLHRDHDDEWECAG